MLNEEWIKDPPQTASWDDHNIVHSFHGYDDDDDDMLYYLSTIIFI